MTHPGGRPRKFNSINELLIAFDEYKKWASKHPWNKKEAVKSGEAVGTIIDLPTERPLTEVGFAVFCNMSITGLREYGKRDEFSYIYEKIKNEMSEQRISGGMAGAYNANLVARIDGLVEKRETDETHRFPNGININFAPDNGDS